MGTDKKNVLVTGGAGFIGSNFINYFVKKYPHYKVINLDLLSYAANHDNVCVQNEGNYKFIQGDIGDKELVTQIFSEYKIDHVIHFAAESHVDNSIASPGIFIQTNIVGTYNLLQTAYNTWMSAPGVKRHEYPLTRFHHISTDEVYGELGDEGYFTETTPYAPNSPYSASKASSDFLVRSFQETYGLNTVVTNCSNNYGPHQHIEKLIPTIIRKALALQPVPIYGKGENVRDWLYVLDHCKAIDQVFHQGREGQTYNVGGDSEKKNIDVAKVILQKMNELRPASINYLDLITFVKDRPGHDHRYAIDATKLKSELNWRPEESFETGIEKTIKWYLGSELN